MEWCPGGGSTRISHHCLQMLDKVIMFRKILKGINTLAYHPQPHPPTPHPNTQPHPNPQPHPNSHPNPTPPHPHPLRLLQTLGPEKNNKMFLNFFQVQQFEKLATSDPGNLIDISPVTGDVINNQILDFEIIKEIQFQVTTGLYYKCLRL